MWSCVQGTHKSLKSNQRAMSTVSGIINGIGSLGAATGPLLIGVITDHLVSVWTLLSNGMGYRV